MIYNKSPGFAIRGFLAGRNKRPVDIFLIKVNGQVFTTPLNTPSACAIARVNAKKRTFESIFFTGGEKMKRKKKSPQHDQ